jgi:hypothetical protein
VKGLVLFGALAAALAASAGLSARTGQASTRGRLWWLSLDREDAPGQAEAPASAEDHAPLPDHATTPPPLTDTRLPFEHHVYTAGTVVLVRPEEDSDLHVVLQSGSNHMITESASPKCDKLATPYRRRQMRVARHHVRLCRRARVTGVAFFDFAHGQTGVAPNAIELHPILHFDCLSS